MTEQRTAGRRAPSGVWRVRVSAMLVLVLVAALTGCRPDGLGPGAAARLVDGALQAETAEGWVDVPVGDELVSGARVRSGPEDDARLQLRGGQLWLAPSSAATLDRGGAFLASGESLVVGDPGLTVAWGGGELTSNGVARLVLGAAPRVGVYEGVAELRRPGEGREVVRYRQVPLSVRRLPATGDPLAYRADDPWDRELLAPAIAFDREAEQLGRGIDGEYGPAPRQAAFYSSFSAVPAALLPSLAATARVVDAGAFGPPSDALLTLFVAQAAAAATGRDVVDLLREVVVLREAGARWGLVALELGVSASGLLAAVDLGQARRIALVPAPDAGDAPSTSPSPDEGPPGPSPAPPSPEPDPGPGAPPPPPPDEPPPGVVEGAVEGILDGVGDTLGPVLRILP